MSVLLFQCFYGQEKLDKSIYVFLFCHCLDSVYMNVSMKRSNEMHFNVVPKTVGFIKFLAIHQSVLLPTFSYVAMVRTYMQQ